jgi:hypothetical protein
MFHSQLSRKLFLAAAAAGFLAVAGCSNQPETTASNQAPKPAKAASKAAASKAEAPKVTPVSAKVSQPTGHTITVPKGTPITAVVDQTLRSDKSHQGDTFAASLAAPVKVDGKTVLPKGAKVTGKVVAVKKHELKVALASVVVHGKSYDLKTNSLRPADKTKSASAKSSDKSKERAKQKNDNSTLSAKSKLTFKLSEPVSVPMKG